MGGKRVMRGLLLATMAGTMLLGAWAWAWSPGQNDSTGAAEGAALRRALCELAPEASICGR